MNTDFGCLDMIVNYLKLNKDLIFYSLNSKPKFDAKI